MILQTDTLDGILNGIQIEKQKRVNKCYDRSMEVRRIKLRQTDKPADRPPGHREIGKVNFQLNIDDRDSGNTN